MYIGDLTIKDINDLDEIKEQSINYRFGKRVISFLGYKLYCTDLAAFYITIKDIFLNKIYDVQYKKKSPLVIDGGAHIGLFSLYTKLKFPESRILAFEPDPDAIDLLKKNVLGNSIKGVQIIEGALTDKKGEIPFSTGLSDGCTIYSQTDLIQVKTFRLSDFIESRVDYLKLNIEGSECDVIYDIEPKLHLIDELCIEYHGFPETGQKLHKILKVLDRNKFRYIIHDYDYETNPYTKPPFVLGSKTKFFLLIYAININSTNK